MYFFFGNHPKKKYRKERSPLPMHLLKSTASSIRAGRAAQHQVHGFFQYHSGCAHGLLADATSIEDALIFNADPSNAEGNGEMGLWAGRTWPACRINPKKPVRTALGLSNACESQVFSGWDTHF